jgi:hypothetical protein
MFLGAMMLRTDSWRRIIICQGGAFGSRHWPLLNYGWRSRVAFCLFPRPILCFYLAVIGPLKARARELRWATSYSRIAVRGEDQGFCSTACWSITLRVCSQGQSTASHELLLRYGLSISAFETACLPNIRSLSVRLREHRADVAFPKLCHVLSRRGAFPFRLNFPAHCTMV